MSEYWKSNAKFWCRFCKLYITDNKSTRNIHDSGTKHKENVERFLREQNQRGRDKEAETARLNKQMDAIEKAAMKQYQLDVEAGLVKAPASSAATQIGPEPSSVNAASSSLPESRSVAAGAAGSYASLSESQISSITSSSLSDSRSEATVETAGSSSDETATTPVQSAPSASDIVKDEAVGQPGAWQTVEVPAPRLGRETAQGDGELRRSDGSHHVLGGDDEDDGVADPEDLRGFKIVEKTYPVEADIPGEVGELEASGGTAVFKKRKAGASKPRNIRRKL